MNNRLLSRKPVSFCDAYIDESSHTGFQYLIFGGIVVPIERAAQLEADLIAVREGTISPAFAENGRPRTLAWKKLNDENFSLYKSIVDTVFQFRIKHNFPPSQEMGVHCLAVDTRIKPLKRTGDGDRETGFEKELYMFCTAVLQNQYREEHFNLYLHKRTARRRLRETRVILNRGSAKHGDDRDWPFKTVEFKESHEFQALQAVDIFAGALANRINGHYDAPGAKAAKRTLSDYVLKLCKVLDPYRTTAFQAKRIFMTILHRPEQGDAPKSGPQNFR